MCGISGFIDFTRKSTVGDLAKMVSATNHRGPDDSDAVIYNYDQCLIGFGHNRLSILDLSPAGHQPMSYKNLSIVFNGEIYNFSDVKKELSSLGHSFKSDSDTEVILHAFDEWGKECVGRFIGMFAFAILNKQIEELYLFRDRAGVKPLFYYWHDGLFLFASELKAFHAHPLFVKEINKVAVHQYMDFGYIPSPNCIFNYTSKLRPAHYLTFSIKNGTFTIDKYWDVRDYYRLPRLDIDYKTAKAELTDFLHSAYEYRMISDVPVGVFLSGGYDSTSVAAILQSSRPNDKIKTFTIGFEQGTNEAPFAKEVAHYLCTDHTEYYCKTKEAQEIVPELPFFYDEPFADSSAIPTILVSKLARKSVTVALSADGGDEIFAGYSIYDLFLKRMSMINKIPVPLRKGTGYFSGAFAKILPGSSDKINHKLQVIERIFKSGLDKDPQKVFKDFFMLNARDKQTIFADPKGNILSSYDGDYSLFPDSLSLAQAIDFDMYLPDDILTKVDRATMSVSLEGREPMLDHRIIEFAAQLPSQYKFGTTQKAILKDIVHDFVPRELMDRPKAGFSIPLREWLKTDLKYLIDDNLNEIQLSKSGLFNIDKVSCIVSDFHSGRTGNADLIWKMIQFQLWFRKWME